MIAAATVFAATCPPLYSCAGGNEPAKEGYLWEISDNGLTEPSYLFGTFHGTFDILYNYVDSIPGYHEAFERARLVCAEIDLSSMDGMSDEATIKKMFEPLPADSTYRELLSPEDYRYLDSTVVAISKELGDSPDPLMSLRPTMLSYMISQMKQIAEMKKKGEEPGQLLSMDPQIINIAKEQSKATTGFETVSEQLEILLVSDKSLREEAEGLIRALKRQIAITQATADIVSAYRSGELAEMERYGVRLDSLVATILSAEELAEYNLWTDKLLRVRNEAWMEKIPEMLAAQPTFIAVGARHLPGKDGLIAMLREKGYTVTPYITRP